MDPNFDKMTGFNLPQPVEGEPQPVAGTEIPQLSPEHAPVSPAEMSGSMTAPISSTSGSSTVPVVPAATPQSDDTGTMSLVTPPATADDQDLIEKEWVHKAKQIVEKTRDDPYIQSKELTKFKADYMQKRYNKSLKMSE